MFPQLADANTVTVNVPGTSDPWLAGMPNGSTASLTDVAPAHSPILVSSLCLSSGSVLGFGATGLVAYGPGDPSGGPDGTPSVPGTHTTAAENGISNVFMPSNALVGVFLGPLQPSLSPAPPALDFSTPASRDYITLSPLLQQTFFIGDGFTSGAVAQGIVVPSGATRLYLGTLDGCCWGNNVGSFDVTVTDPCTTIAVEATSWEHVKALYR